MARRVSLVVERSNSFSDSGRSSVRDEAGMFLADVVAGGAVAPALSHAACRPHLVHVPGEVFEQRFEVVGQVDVRGIDRLGRVVGHGLSFTAHSLARDQPGYLSGLLWNTIR